MAYEPTSIQDRLTNFLFEASFVTTEGATAKEEILQKVGSIIQQILILSAVIFTILLLYAGFLWMTAQGKEDQVKKAIDLFRTAILGVLILTFAAAITYTIIFYLTITSTT